MAVQVEQNHICLSLGGGVQSTVLALLLDRGLLGPLPELAIFADTGGEPPQVYDNIEWLMGEVKNYPIVVTRTWSGTRGFINLKDDLKAQVGHNGTALGGGPIPQFTINKDGNRGMVQQRQCTTTEYTCGLCGALQSIHFQPINRTIQRDSLDNSQSLG